MLGRFVYDRGTTYFETQMRTVERLRPDAVVLPLPVEDVETVAPQITFFGLDTLDIRVLGTGGWTRSEVLQGVDARHTNGVVAVTPETAKKLPRTRTSEETAVREAAKAEKVAMQPAAPTTRTS